MLVFSVSVALYDFGPNHSHAPELRICKLGYYQSSPAGGKGGGKFSFISETRYSFFIEAIESTNLFLSYDLAPQYRRIECQSMGMELLCFEAFMFGVYGFFIFFSVSCRQ